MYKYLKTDNKNVELYYCVENANNPKANIIINHGFAEHLGRYKYLAKRLVDAGYNVLRYDLRGHGKSKGLKGHVESYHNLISDADAMVNIMIDTNPKLPIFMVGHSMGGMVTALYGIKYPQKLAGQILSGAATNTLPMATPFKASILSISSKIFPKLQLKNPIDSDICSVKEVVADYINDPLVLKSATLNFYNEFLNKGVKYVSNNFKQYKLPVLILHGKDDAIVPYKMSESFYNNISSVNKEIKVFPNLYHEIFNEKEKDLIIDRVIKWLEKNK